MSSAGFPGLHELDKIGTENSFNTNICYAVANYCFPNRYPSSKVRSEIRRDSEIVFSYGIHPRTVHSTESKKLIDYFGDLQDIIQSTRTVAIGECGLDTTDRPSSTQLQKQIVYLNKQLQLAVSHKLAIIIHCRGNSNLHLQLFDCLTNICPSDHSIHWHCFTGSQRVFDAINSRFTNIIFGITPFIFTNQYPEITQFISKNGLDQLVLESDAPFIKYMGRPGTPYVVNFVANKIAELLNVPFEKVVEVTSQNAQKIYGKGR